MWVARDKDGELLLYSHKPHRCTAPGWNNEYWDSPDLVDDEDETIDTMILNPKLFPGVTWETEPLEVVLKQVE